MKKRLLSILLVVTLVFQPISVEATQEESIEVISETETETADTEATETVAEETEAESASQEVIDLENEMVTFNTGEEIELQEVFVEDAEGVYQEGSFKVPMSEADSERALLSATEEETWENWETYIKGKLEARSGEITVSSYNIATSDISTWYWGVINENPDLYYVSGAFSYSNNNGIVYSIYPTYIDGYDDAAFQNATAEAMAILTDDMTDLEKAIALHDYIVLNCEYDYDNFLAGTIPDESYSAYGVLVDRIAVCQGYALAYKYLLQEAGITCYMVSSATMNHAWNMIQLNGKYYQVDATWDDPVWDLIGRVDHTYMFVSDTKFQNELKHENWQVTYRNNLKVVKYILKTLAEYYTKFFKIKRIT